MSQLITNFRVFIASPSGLDKERGLFRRVLLDYSASDGEPRGSVFHPTGWEETIGGAGRPQELINADLRKCDYAVFVFHDRWGTPTGNGPTSGTLEEWELALELYRQAKIRDLVLFFKKVEKRQLRDPGDQLKKVLEFKERIQNERRFLYRDYESADEFSRHLRRHLAKWLRDQETLPQNETQKPSVASHARDEPTAEFEPPYKYWWKEVKIQYRSHEHEAALFCAKKALSTATSEFEWAKSKNYSGAIYLELKKIKDAIDAFSEVEQRVSLGSSDEHKEWHARVLVNKALCLRKLERVRDELAIYDDVLARFGRETASGILDMLAFALACKAEALASLGSRQEEIATYDDIANRFAGSSEVSLLEDVGRALNAKASVVTTLGREDDALVIYDQIACMFNGREGLETQVLQALLNKTIQLKELERYDQALESVDVLLKAAAQHQSNSYIAIALGHRGHILQALNRCFEAMNLYEEIFVRFSSSNDPLAKFHAAAARMYRARTLISLNRRREALPLFDTVLAHASSERYGGFEELVADAAIEKANCLYGEGERDEAIRTLTQFIEQFQTATEELLLQRRAYAFLQRGSILAELSRHTEALESYELAVEQYAGLPEADRTQIASVLLRKVDSLEALGDGKSAIAVLNEIVHRFENATDSEVRFVVEDALYQKVKYLGSTGAISEAISTVDKYLNRLTDASDAEELTESLKSVKRELMRVFLENEGSDI
ncbi:hypothetical protein C2U70_23935 [Bradyrhizobium guangdongense]|uniref:tetratricopeptide repeat protein n=1 Tax=Bradyrhizobium guangdongense TaxID=1325090 RepID=UPI001126C20C|nr:DUF4062 domain-containing protein [Bradyrhizobium guangdongense]TPQ31552.1 hypothetical protein C2U70_23935 [Bradyrhizobium guangdongense]